MLGRQDPSKRISTSVDRETGPNFGLVSIYGASMSQRCSDDNEDDEEDYGDTSSWSHDPALIWLDACSGDSKSRHRGLLVGPPGPLLYSILDQATQRKGPLRQLKQYTVSVFFFGLPLPVDPPVAFPFPHPSPSFPLPHSSAAWAFFCFGKWAQAW